MESEIDPTESERARLAFMSRIAHMVLPDSGGIDRRDAMMLVDCGVIHANQEEAPDEAIELARTAANGADDVTHGPLISFCGASGSNSMARARDLLLDERQRARRISLAHLESTAASAGLVSAPTVEALERLRPAILSSAGWRRAAVELVDILDDDWLLNIAGARQCQAHHLVEQGNDYLSAALRPSMAAVRACSPRMLCPSLHLAEMGDYSVRMSEVEQPIEDLCAKYMENLGHVPLGGDCAFAEVLARREGSEPLAVRLTTVLDWASRSSSPLARYHACEFAVSAAVHLTPEQRETVSRWFWEMILPHECVDQPTHVQETWALAAQLAKYYIQYFEVRLPSDHGEAIAAMAWWMTSRIMAVVPVGTGGTLAFGTQLDQTYGTMATEIWSLIGHPMAQSMLRSMTTFGPSPWALSIISAVNGEDDVQWLMAGTGPGTADERMRMLITVAVQIANVALAGGNYRFSEAARRVLGWVANAQPDENTRLMISGWADGVDWSPPDSLTKALDALDKQEVQIQRWMCHAIRERVAGGTLSGDDLWKAVTSETWKQSSWLALDLVSVEALGYALIEHAVRLVPEWLPQLPHLFAEIAELRSESESDRPTLFGMVLRACSASNTSSAISRLLRGNAGSRYRALAATVRGNLELALPQAGGWAAGRLRALMVDLLQ